MSLLAGSPQLPATSTDGLGSSVHLTVGSDGLLKAREIWQGVGGDLKAGILLSATVAADSWDWTDEAPAVQRISVLTAPKA